MTKLTKVIRSAVFCLCIIVGGLYGSVLAGELSEIELTDGSIIRGEIVSFINGVYTVKSGSVGTVRIDESDVQLIRVKSEGPHTREPSGSSLSSEAQALQQLMTLLI